MQGECLLLTGLSGSGKSTVGRAAAAAPGRAFIEGDDYYDRDNIPLATLSDGSRVKNWDCAAALDWARLNADVKAALRANRLVVLALYQPLLHLLEFPVARHVRLRCGGDEAARCAEARARSKPFSAAGRARDARVVAELVYPAYLAAVGAAPPPDAEVRVCDAGGRRRPVGELAEAVLAALAAPPG